MSRTQAQSIRPLVVLLHKCFAWIDSPLEGATVGYILGVAVFTVVYFLTAHWGLTLSPVSGFATFVWPPTGISIAVLVLAGPKYWPGIFLGAFWVNSVNGADMPVALAIAIGNTLGPVTGAYLLNKFHFEYTMQKIRDVVLLVGCAACFSTLISATVGTTSLLIGGNINVSGYFFTWLTWWIGDTLGILIIAPLVFVWPRRITAQYSSKRFVEALALCAIFITIGIVIFDAIPESEPVLAGAPYLLFSFLIWAALRFNIRYITTMIFLLSVMAIWSAKFGHGPFYHDSLRISLFATQLFMGATAVTFLIFCSVISERRQAQNTIQRLNKKLQKSLNVTTEKLRQEREIEKLRDEFVATASHELKTPVTSIKAYAQILVKNLQELRELKNAQLAISINDHANILTDRVKELLDASTMTAGNITLNKTLVDVDSIVERIVSNFALEANGHSIKLSGRVNIQIRADKHRIEQVLMNVLANAMKFSPANSPIKVIVKKHRFNITIAVKDRGPGISENDQIRIFQKFYRTEDADETKLAVSGIGLGLYIASEIIRRHHGSMWVESKLGHGATFYISLPINTNSG